MRDACTKKSFLSSALVFGFSPDIYLTNEEVGSQVLTVILVSGDLGDLQLILTVVTNESSTLATATGKLYKYKAR